MKRVFLVLLVLLIGCVSSPPAPEPAEPPSSASPLPAAEAGPMAIQIACADDPITPGGCFREGPESEPIKDLDGVQAWYAADEPDGPSARVCPKDWEIWHCYACRPQPANCVWASGGQVPGMKTLCCDPTGKPVPACTPTDPPYQQTPECPQPLDDRCNRGICAAGKCGLSYASTYQQPCKDSATPGTTCHIEIDHGPVGCFAP